MTKQQSPKPTWRDLFTRVPGSDPKQPAFYVRGSHKHLLTPHGYDSKHQVLNRILKALRITPKQLDWNSIHPTPTTIYHETTIPFSSSADDFEAKQDGFLEIRAGNYRSLGFDSQGAWIHGFPLLREVLCSLKIPEPRRLKGEPPPPPQLHTLYEGDDDDWDNSALEELGLYDHWYASSLANEDFRTFLEDIPGITIDSDFWGGDSPGHGGFYTAILATNASRAWDAILRRFKKLTGIDPLKDPPPPPEE